MSAHHITRFLVVLSAPVVLGGAQPDVPSAHAGTCPDVQVVFARGTGEDGLGEVGQTFVDALKSRVAGRSIEVYPVNYPASAGFPVSSKQGADDTSAHVQSMVAGCPDTRMVLGGYSQGAGVIDWASTLMPKQVADHVAAVALFGNPSSIIATALSGGYPPISPLYSAKTIDLCAPGDPTCSIGLNALAHGTYVESGMTTQAATFVASRLQR